MMSTTAPAHVSGRWIISRNQDLFWFIGSALLSYAAIGALQLGVPFALIFMIWIFGLDGPHVIATITRTYFDGQERARLGLFTWIIIPAIIIGPLAVWAGQMELFLLFAVCWQAWHVAKQHFGFMMLYKAKNRERGTKLELIIEKWTVLASFMAPLAYFLISTRSSFTAGVRDTVLTVLTLVYAGVIVAFCTAQIAKKKRGAQINTPKILLLAAVIPVQWVALAHALQFGSAGLIRMSIAGGIFHAMQYHRLIWFHNRNRYADRSSGLAWYFSRSVFAYVSLVVVIYFVLWLAGNASPYMSCAVWGIAFTHYLLDSKIWRLREDKQLAAALGM
jgi:hypothetical protein